jgi:hypothetical protein
MCKFWKKTLRTMRWKGSSTYVGARRKPDICEEELSIISDALINWLKDIIDVW